MSSKIKNFSGIFLSIAVILSCAGSARSDSPDTAPFAIGALFSLTGYGQLAGQAELNGVQLAIEEINRAGGIKGRAIKLKAEDDRSDLKATAEAMHKLVGVDRVPVVIGPNWAEFSEVAAGAAQQEKSVMVTPSGWTKTLTDNRPFVFSALESHRAIVKPLADLIISRHPKKIAVVLSDNSYFQSLDDALVSQLQRAGIEIWKTFSFNPTETDFKSTITRINSEKVDTVIVLTIENGSTYDFFKQAKQLKLTAQLYSGNVIRYDSAVTKDLPVVNGVIFFDYALTLTPEFSQNYESRFKIHTEFDAGRAYDLVYLLKGAAEECGFSSDEIRTCLMKMHYRGVSGDLSFDATRNLTITQQPSKLWTVTDGKIVPL